MENGRLVLDFPSGIWEEKNRPLCALISTPLLRFASWYLTLTDELTIGNGEHGAVTLIMKTFMAMNFDDVLDLSAEVQSGT